MPEAVNESKSGHAMFRASNHRFISRQPTSAEIGFLNLAAPRCYLEFPL